MKKLMTLGLLAMFTLGLTAQESTAPMLLNYNSLTKKAEKSDLDIQNEKKNIKAATWIKRGDTYKDIFNLGLEQTYEGMDSKMLKLIYQEPNTVETKTNEDGSQEEILVYDDMSYVFVNGGLTKWERQRTISEDPLGVATEAYIKAQELDTKGKLAEKVKESLSEIKDFRKREGINNYYSGSYDASLACFEQVLQINKHELFAGEFDTVMVQYSGIISREIASKTESKDLYLKAIDYYNQLAEVGFGGPNTYLQIKMDYLSIQDTAMALETMTIAYEKYPDSLSIITNLADIYIKSKMIDEGIEFMARCVEDNPDKAEAFYWQGRMLINKEGAEYIEKAVASYKKATEINPIQYFAWYDLGYIFYLEGQDYYDRSNGEDHEPTRDKLIEMAKEKYDEAIPVLEKAYELNDTNMDVKFDTLDLLQRIYYKEQMMDDYNRVKALKDAL